MEFSSLRNSESGPRVQVLPRDETREHLIAIADMLAKVMDTTVKIPGTSWYIGLDPLLGLIPGIGDVWPISLARSFLGWRRAYNFPGSCWLA